jgi:hypothetical protein
MNSQRDTPPSSNAVAGASSALPPPLERLAAYRRILASPRDEAVDWWYFGTTTVDIQGMPAITVINAATLMIYRTETLADDRFAIHWDEVGYFSDYVTGQPLTHWLNPVTGRRVAAPQSFAEGPARYEVAGTPDGVAVSLTQPGATVNSIDVEWSCAEGRISLVQQERKIRGFPDVDGQLPDPASASGFEAVTKLAFVADWPGSGAEARGGSDAQGLYEFALTGAPAWMGFQPRSAARATVRGVIVKASPERPPNPDALQRLRGHFPGFFARHGR